jgi:hypothetical protein
MEEANQTPKRSHKKEQKDYAQELLEEHNSQLQIEESKVPSPKTH